MQASRNWRSSTTFATRSAQAIRRRTRAFGATPNWRPSPAIRTRSGSASCRRESTHPRNRSLFPARGGFRARGGSSAGKAFLETPGVDRVPPGRRGSLRGGPFPVVAGLPRVCARRPRPAAGGGGRHLDLREVSGARTPESRSAAAAGSSRPFVDRLLHDNASGRARLRGAQLAVRLSLGRLPDLGGQGAVTLLSGGSQ